MIEYILSEDLSTRKRTEQKRLVLTQIERESNDTQRGECRNKESLSVSCKWSVMVFIPSTGDCQLIRMHLLSLYTGVDGS